MQTAAAENARAVRRVLQTRAVRRVLQTRVVVAMRPEVSRLVRKLGFTPGQRDEAEQVAMIGVLVALETFDPTGRVSFRRFALGCAATEIVRWLDAGAVWMPRKAG